MKLRITLLFLLSIILTKQNFAQKGINIGANALFGPSYILSQNTYYLAGNSKELDYKFKLGINANVHVGYNFKEKHGIIAQVGYGMEGQKYKDEFNWPIYGLNGVHEKNVSFKYAGFSVLYKFSPILAGQKDYKKPEDWKVRMKVIAGFQMDFLLDADMTYKVTKIDGTSFPLATPAGGPIYGSPYATTNDVKSFYQPMQALAVIGFGFDYFITNKLYMGAALETKVGLNDINDKTYRTHPQYKKSKNYLLGLNVAIGYYLKGGKAEKDKFIDKKKKK